MLVYACLDRSCRLLPLAPEDGVSIEVADVRGANHHDMVYVPPKKQALLGDSPEVTLTAAK